MDYNILVKILKKIGNESTIRFSEYELIEKDCLDFLSVNKNCTEIWIRLALLNFRDPIGDYPKSIEFLQKVLEYDDNNLDTLLILSFITGWYWSESDTKLIDKIIFLSKGSSEIESIGYYLKAWTYYNVDEENFSYYLKKSIEVFAYHVNNFVDLGSLYIRKGLVLEGQDLIKKAINNVKIIYPEDDSYEYDFTDKNEFINERLKGNHITKINYDTLLEKLLN